MDRPPNGNSVADHVLLEESLELIAPVADDVIATFYEQLFADHPDVRPMFPAQMAGQREKLLTAIVELVTNYERPEALVPTLSALGRQHNGFGVRIDHYSAVGITLLSTLRRYAGDAWTPAYEGAWLRAYTFAAGVMMQAGAVPPAMAQTGHVPAA